MKDFHGVARALGAGIGIGNFGILGLQRALGAGIGIGNFGILGFCNLRWGPELELGISESWVCKERWGPENWNWEFRNPEEGRTKRLGLQFPVSEFEPQIPDSTTYL